MRTLLRIIWEKQSLFIRQLFSILLTIQAQVKFCNYPQKILNMFFFLKLLKFL